MSTRDQRALVSALRRLEGRSYKAYRSIGGAWTLSNCTLLIDHVQGDPFAAPSRVRVIVEPSTTRLPGWSCAPGSRAVALGSHLARAFCSLAAGLPSRGSGKSGRIEMTCPGQQVLDQTAVMVDRRGRIEARFTVGLPARGRRILGREAVSMLTDDVPDLVDRALCFAEHASHVVRRAVETNEDADALRGQLDAAGLVAFVADGASLPRASGVDDRPLTGDDVVAFRAPDRLRVTLEAPNAGDITGMGIPRGVTLIVGGGYHGKSTLLRAIERGVYNHRPDDGRERVVTDADTVKIRAEDGRAVTAVDISTFIEDLPRGVDTTAFTSVNASGSTSQAAAIMEAVESGARGLLLDEDTSATNFMIRDRRMQELVPKAGEPITPFLDRVRWLYAERGLSTVLVIGGSGDYLEVADTVIAMRDFCPSDVSDAARRVVAEHPTGRLREGSLPPTETRRRVPMDDSIGPERGRRRVHVRTRGRHRIEFGEADLDLRSVDQIVTESQTRALARALAYVRLILVDGRRSIADILDRTAATVAESGLDALDDRLVGDLASFRRHELAAALNRLRGLRIDGGRP